MTEIYNLKSNLDVWDPLPFYLLETHPAFTPEQHLLAAVLEDAWNEIRTDSALGIRVSQAKLAKIDALNWIKGKTQARISFAFCCENLCLDEQAVRKKMLASINGKSKR